MKERIKADAFNLDVLPLVLLPSNSRFTGINMEVVDLSHPLDPDNMSIYPGDPVLLCSPCATIEKDGYAVRQISMGSHTGTHVDAPSHLVHDGKTIDEIPLSMLVGPALVVDVSHKQRKEPIIWDDFLPYASDMKEGPILLVYTGWSKHWTKPAYLKDYPYLTRDAAEKILASGISVVGFDTLSPDRVDGDDFGVHEAVLGAGGLIVENLTNLDLLFKGPPQGAGWTVNLLPLNIRGSDGAPVRAIAFAS